MNKITYKKELQKMGFSNIEELRKALNEYKEKNFPEDCIPEMNINIDFDYSQEDFDFSFLDNKKEEKE